MQTIEIVARFDFGAPGVDDDPANPLSRALDALLKRGRPIQNLALCFFGGLAEARDHTTGPRWLGAFVVSDRGTIVFFPGFEGVWLQRYHERGKEFRKFALDHFTLNSNLASWHATSLKRKTHQRVGATTSLGEGRYLWMPMSVAGETDLRQLSRDTIAKLQVPASATQQRKEAFTEATDQAQHLWVSLDPEARRRYWEGFLHFAFIIGPTGFRDERQTLNFPPGPPSLKAPLGDLSAHLPLRIARLSLSPNVDLEVVSAWLPGVLQAPVVFTIG